MHHVSVVQFLIQKAPVQLKQMPLEAERFCPQRARCADQLMRLLAGPLQVMKDF
jgi:hypothetical protein